MLFDMCRCVLFVGCWLVVAFCGFVCCLLFVIVRCLIRLFVFCLLLSVGVWCLCVVACCVMGLLCVVCIV